MGLYSRWIFPKLCDLALNQPPLIQQRRELLAAAEGLVLEIGFGSGLNLPHYPRNVRKLVAIEPNRGMLRLARQRIEQAGIEVEQRMLPGEGLPIADDTFDCAVSTLTLCSIDDVNQALAQIFRVLRPGGRLLFLEHGLSPEPTVARWQRRLNPVQRWLGDGCRLDRPMKQLIASQPFTQVECSEFYLEKTPKTHGYMYRGVATK
jgi:ubiquinone/menaquinone biosynthesis C-methylase UbiE